MMRRIGTGLLIANLTILVSGFIRVATAAAGQEQRPIFRLAGGRRDRSIVDASWRDVAPRGSPFALWNE